MDQHMYGDRGRVLSIRVCFTTTNVWGQGQPTQGHWHMHSPTLRVCGGLEDAAYAHWQQMLSWMPIGHCILKVISGTRGFSANSWNSMKLRFWKWIRYFDSRYVESSSVTREHELVIYHNHLSVKDSAGPVLYYLTRWWNNSTDQSTLKGMLETMPRFDPPVNHLTFSKSQSVCYCIAELRDENTRHHFACDRQWNTSTQLAGKIAAVATEIHMGRLTGLTCVEHQLVYSRPADLVP